LGRNGIICGMTPLILMSLLLSPIALSAPYGTFLLSTGSDPITLNPWAAVDGPSRDVLRYILEPLGALDDDGESLRPLLAEGWTVSKDGKVFTFKLRPSLKWTDGQPITAEDVKFSYDAILDPKFGAVAERTAFESIQGIKILDSRTVQFYVKSVYYRN